MTAAWTKENTLKLIDSLRNNIPEDEISSVYTKGLEAVDWEKVAFDPFSPTNCRKKWERIIKRVQKTRSLAELINAAESSIYDPTEKIGGKTIKRKKSRKHRLTGEPVMPARTGYVIFFQEQVKLNRGKLSGSRNNFRDVSNLWLDLPDTEKKAYAQKMQQGMTEYSIELWKWFQKLSPARKNNFLQRNPNKKSYLKAGETKVNEGEYPPRHTALTTGGAEAPAAPLLPTAMDSEDEDIESGSSSSDEFFYSEGEEMEGDGHGDTFEVF